MHYEGDDARNIQTFTRNAVKDALYQGLLERSALVGEDDIVLLKSAVAAKKRFDEGKAFILIIQQPAQGFGCRVLGADGRAHSGWQYDWTFMLQLSQSRIGGKVPNEKIVEADEALNDLVRSIFLERYGYFRSIGFYDLRVDPRDDSSDRTQVLNPLVLRFFNKIRLPQDTFLTV